jgi:hypothetical protein
MAITPNENRGTGDAVPKQPETPKWVTDEECEYYDKILFKPFVRKIEKVSAESKKFFYMITQLHPCEPGGKLTQEGQSLMEFHIQKFHRDKTAKRNVYEPGRKQAREEEFNEPVQKNVWNEKLQIWKKNDDDAQFNMDSRDFLAQFKRDEE